MGVWYMQYVALRLCTCAFKTTLTSALQVETGEMSIEIRKTQLSLNLCFHLRGHSQDHPTQGTFKALLGK